MMKHASPTLAFSLVFFAGAASAHASSGAVTSVTPSTEVACSTRQDVDRGWEFQMELLEARLAAKGSQSLEVKGAIIRAPFPDFAPYRKDVPAPLASSARSGAARTSEPVGHPSSPQKR